MPQRIIFPEARSAVLEDFQLTEPGPDQIHVKARYSLMSTGTEGICYGRLFEPDTHWDRWVKYPFEPGYAMVGEVVSTGAAVEAIRPGQYVAVRKGHASEAIVAANEATVIPDGVDLQQATWFALAKIASHGARAADFQLGQSVAIVGAGPVGQMAVRWAAASGVESLVVIDIVEDRLGMARAGGATAVVNQPVGEALDAVHAACHRPGGPDVVMEVTGHHAVFAPTLALPRQFGRVVLLGDTGKPSGQHLTVDVVTRGLTIVGAHDTHNDETWNQVTASTAFFKLVQAGRFNLDGLITHTFKPDHADQAYKFAATRRAETMGILFDWT